ncbi:hypothetical protein ACFL13_02650 [Patescibacteria group bacterium]
MDIQTLQIFIYAIATVVLVVIGIYAVFVLKELHTTLKRVNSVLDDVGSITNIISNPLSIISSIIEGIKAVKNFHKES